jgi:hypothetical protein
MGGFGKIDVPVIIPPGTNPLTPEQQARIAGAVQGGDPRLLTQDDKDNLDTIDDRIATAKSAAVSAIPSFGTVAGTSAEGNDARLLAVADKADAAAMLTALASKTSKGDIALNVRDYGAKGNGSADDSAALINAFNDAALQGRDLELPAGVYRLTGTNTITWDTDMHGVRGLGDVTIDATSKSSGFAFNIIGRGSRSTTLNGRSTMHKFERMRILGPDTDSTTVDGFYFNDSSNLSQVNFDSIMVFGFRDQHYFDTNNWCLRWFGSSFGHAHRRAFAFYSGTNAGENYSFYGCTFYSSTNAAGNATAIYTDYAGNSDIYCFGCSFDYDDIEIDHNSGIFSLSGCHIENKSAGPMIRLSYTPGFEYTRMSISGGVLAPTERTALDPDPNGQKRDRLIDMVSGNAVHLNIDGTYCATYNQTHDVVKVTSGSPTVSFRAPMGTSTGTAPNLSRPGELLNVLSNAGFESGSINQGWYNQGTVSYSVQSVGQKSGSYALRIVGTGVAGTTSITQARTCQANAQVIATAEMFASGVTAGSTVIRLAWLASDGSTISTTSLPGVSADQAYGRVGGVASAPAGTAFVQYELYSTNLNGTVFVDDTYLAVLNGVSSGAKPQFGSAANTFAQGNDSRIVNAVQAGKASGAVVSKSASYTAVSTDGTVLATAGAAGITITLPAAASAQQLVVKKVDAGTGDVTVVPASGTIDGASNTLISTRYAVVTVVSDGTNWFLI